MIVQMKNGGISMLDYIRIACAVPAVTVGDTKKNAQDICGFLKKADTGHVDLLVFPEMALTGYTCQDLFFQDALYEGVRQGLREILECSAACPGVTALVGLPLRLGVRMFNCAAVISGGAVQGIVPKISIPNYNEFYEKRWFASGDELTQDSFDIGSLLGTQPCQVPIGQNLLFRIGEGTLLGVEICEDLWTPLPPSTMLALSGAEVIVNLSASNETIGKRTYRRNLVQHQSGALNCVYAYCSAGSTESTQDLIFSGQSLIGENGTLLAESREAIATDYLLVQDCDLGKIRADRRKNRSFADAASRHGAFARIVEAASGTLRGDGSEYRLEKLPFVPSQRQNRVQRCMEIFHMQVAGLKQRLSVIGNANAVIGISGGLDSTLALLVAVEAMRQLGRPATDVYGVTMPCFGTSDRTYKNSWDLMRTLGISCKEINIREAVNLHFSDIGHDSGIHDGTYENSQARERTQILMDYASVVHGIVVGTGDLSELALGWCTYNGDHMSMYAVNCSIPKTLVRHLVAYLARDNAKKDEALHDVLEDILDTPVSPELLPAVQGQISQKTEDLVGPYELHDFFLYYMLRWGFSPRKVYRLAVYALGGQYSREVILKWLKTFYRRFFSQQFKRNCVPDGPKIGSVALSPRGDWRMPSDAKMNLWQAELDTLE